MSKPIWKIAALAVLLPSTTFASDGLNGANTAWILTATALVLLMTLPGLSLFYGGLVRVKNILSKQLGSNNLLNNARATINGLSSLRSYNV